MDKTLTIRLDRAQEEAPKSAWGRKLSERNWR